MKVMNIVYTGKNRWSDLNELHFLAWPILALESGWNIKNNILEDACRKTIGAKYYMQIHTS